MAPRQCDVGSGGASGDAGRKPRAVPREIMYGARDPLSGASVALHSGGAHKAHQRLGGARSQARMSLDADFMDLVMSLP